MKKSVAIVGLLTGLLVQGCTSSPPSGNVPVRMMGANGQPVVQNNQPLYPTRQAVTQPVMHNNNRNPSSSPIGQAQIVSVSPYEGQQIQKPQVNTAPQPTYRSASVYTSQPTPPVQPVAKPPQPRGMFDLPPQQQQQAAAKPAAMPTPAPIAVASNAPVVPKTTSMSITDVLDATIRNAPDENMTPEKAIATARTSMPATPLENSGPGQAVASIPEKPATGQGHQPSKQALASLGREKPRFYWPVKGNVISNFGAKGSGKQNDGINISAPKGTAVKAAAAGLVVYSGQDLGGLGNLILIRHSGGYHTAYAHVDNKLVKTGDKVSTGEAIANIGKSGNVTTPQLHFEIRDGKKPVNPDSFLPRA